MMVLGLHFEHDAGACLMQDGRILINIEAERITGGKHDFGLSAACASMQAALAQSGIKPAEVDAIAFSDLWEGRVYPGQQDLLPQIQAQTHGPDLAARIGTLQEIGLADSIACEAGHLRPEIPVFLTCHSMCHAAGALYMSGFGEAAGLVIDGYGTCCGMMGYHYRDGTLSRVESLKDRFLLGAGYHGIGTLAREIVRTSALDVAGKVMGLQAYGKARSEWVRYFRDIYFPSSAETGFDDFVRQASRYAGSESTERYCADLFPGGLGAGSMTVDDQTYRDLVASMQEAFTGIVRDMALELVAISGESQFFLSGGCALNIIANSAVAQLADVSAVFVPPNASDCGQAMGAAILGMHALSGQPLHRPEIAAAVRGNPYIGARLLDDPGRGAHPGDIVSASFDWDCPAQVSALARRYLAGEIIGVIGGSSEIGPRALGNRSILALASHPDMKDIINFKIKRREWWRPFAPVCRLQDADRYFEPVVPSRYMLMNSSVRPAWRATLAAITHQDHTCRLQTLFERADNPRLWDLLAALEAEGAVPILVNTSFNLSRKPIANSTQEAMELLVDSRMDAVVVEDVIFSKTPEGRRSREQAEIAPYFDAAFYQHTYPEVAATGLSSIDHYIAEGWREGRDPNAWFSSRWYLESYADVGRAGNNPLWDFVRFGWRAGRVAAGRGAESALRVKFPLLMLRRDATPPDEAARVVRGRMDPVFYRDQLVTLGIHIAPDECAKHYLDRGAACGLDPAPWFSTLSYLRDHDDVAQAGLNPFLHYVLHGESAGKVAVPSAFVPHA